MLTSDGWQQCGAETWAITTFWDVAALHTNIPDSKDRSSECQRDIIPWMQNWLKHESWFVPALWNSYWILLLGASCPFCTWWLSGSDILYRGHKIRSSKVLWRVLPISLGPVALNYTTGNCFMTLPSMCILLQPKKKQANKKNWAQNTEGLGRGMISIGCLFFPSWCILLFLTTK